MVNLLAKNLPTIPPIDSQSYSQHSRSQQGRQQHQHFPAARSTSPAFQRPKPPHIYQFSQQSPVFQHLPVPNVKCSSDVDPKTLAIDFPGGTSSLEDNNHRRNNNNKSSGIISTSGRAAKDQRATNNGVTRIDSKVQQRVSRLQQLRQPSQPYDIHRDNGKAWAMQDGKISPVLVKPLSRRFSFKKEGSGGDRRKSFEIYNPLLPSQPQQQHHRLQNLAGRVCGQIAF